MNVTCIIELHNKQNIKEKEKCLVKSVQYVSQTNRSINKSILKKRKRRKQMFFNEEKEHVKCPMDV